MLTFASSQALIAPSSFALILRKLLKLSPSVIPSLGSNKLSLSFLELVAIHSCLRSPCNVVMSIFSKNEYFFFICCMLVKRFRNSTASSLIAALFFPLSFIKIRILLPISISPSCFPSISSKSFSSRLHKNDSCILSTILNSCLSEIIVLRFLFVARYGRLNSTSTLTSSFATSTISIIALLFSSRKVFLAPSDVCGAILLCHPKILLLLTDDILLNLFIFVPDILDAPSLTPLLLTLLVLLLLYVPWLFLWLHQADNNVLPELFVFLPFMCEVLLAGKHVRRYLFLWKDIFLAAADGPFLSWLTIWSALPVTSGTLLAWTFPSLSSPALPSTLDSCIPFDFRKIVLFMMLLLR